MVSTMVSMWFHRISPIGSMSSLMIEGGSRSKSGLFVFCGGGGVPFGDSTKSTVTCSSQNQRTLQPEKTKGWPLLRNCPLIVALDQPTNPQQRAEYSRTHTHKHIVSELRRHRSGYRFHLSTSQHMKHTLTLTACDSPAETSQLLSTSRVRAVPA